MLIIADVFCKSCNTRNEVWMENKERVAPCPRCGALADRKISAVTAKLDSSFPGWKQKWARQHEKAAKTDS